MIFNDRSSRRCSNVSAPNSSTRIKRNNFDHDHNEAECSSKLAGRKLASIRQQIHAMGPVCKSRRKAALSGLSSQGKDEEEGDLAKQFAEEGWSNDDASSWLSSGSSSPSCCFDDQIFGNLLDFSLDDWLVSLLIQSTKLSPRISRATTFIDGSRVNPLEEATSVLQRSSHQEEEITTWLTNSVEVEDEECLRCRRRNSELPQNGEIQKLGFFGSLIDLEGENSEWISDVDLDFLQIDFPSPCCKSSWSSETQSSAASSDVSSLIEAKKEENEHNELTDYRAGEPLF